MLNSDGLKGVQLLAVYLILGLAFFFIPATPGHRAQGVTAHVD